MTALLMIVLFGYGAYLLRGQLFTLGSPLKVFQQDLEAMQEAFATAVPSLSPWQREEVGLLSFNTLKSTLPLPRMEHGIFTNIYQEPMLLFAQKRYTFKQLQGLLCVKTSAHLVAYKFTPQGIDVVLDAKWLGRLQPNDFLYASDNTTPLAAVISHPDTRLWSIMVKGVEKASMQDPAYLAQQVNPRVFVTYQPANPQEEAYILALAFYKLVQYRLKKQ